MRAAARPPRAPGSLPFLPDSASRPNLTFRTRSPAPPGQPHAGLRAGRSAGGARLEPPSPAGSGPQGPGGRRRGRGGASAWKARCAAWGAASGSQVPVETAAAPRPARAVPAPPPSAPAGSPLPLGIAPGSPRHIPARIRSQAGGALPRAGPGPSAPAGPPPPPPPARLRDAPARPALAAAGAHESGAPRRAQRPGARRAKGQAAYYKGAGRAPRAPATPPAPPAQPARAGRASGPVGGLRRRRLAPPRRPRPPGTRIPLRQSAPGCLSHVTRGGLRTCCFPNARGMRAAERERRRGCGAL